MIRRWKIVAITAGCLLFLILGTILPRTTTQVFGSPDETAVAAFARNWKLHEGFRLPSVDISLSDIAGLHPRSMVQQGEWLVPVGFLGMPLLALPFEKAIQGSSGFLTAILVLSSAFALFRLAELLGRRAAWTATIVYLSFPTVLLYVNRGLFPNLPVVALGLWTMYLLRFRKEAWTMVVAGLALGLALTIRPIEAVWLLPWIIWVGWGRVRGLGLRVFLIAAVTICVIGYGSAVHTYGSWMPKIGYWLQDTPPENPFAHAVNLLSSSPGQTGTLSFAAILPFGIHPRSLASNIQAFIFGIMGPWVAAALGGWVLWMWRTVKKTLLPTTVVPMLLTAWTTVVLLLLYGQARYTDNITDVATLGNSFLRYVLPLVPLIAVGVGLLVEELFRHEVRWKFLAVGLTIFFVLFGVAQALVRDDEAIMPTKLQLQRYLTIRDAAQRLLPSNTIVISERSDKIFVGDADMIGVSPLPSAADIATIEMSGRPIALFHRVLSPGQQQSFNDGSFAHWQMIDTFDNEALYVPPTRNVPFQ